MPDLVSKLVDGISRMCISAAHLRRSAREVRAGVCVHLRTIQSTGAVILNHERNKTGLWILFTALM